MCLLECSLAIVSKCAEKLLPMCRQLDFAVTNMYQGQTSESDSNRKRNFDRPLNLQSGSVATHVRYRPLTGGLGLILARCVIIPGQPLTASHSGAIGNVCGSKHAKR
jgi:hypothetical protein